jgi:apolipoprotein N-acyltransferase
MNKKELLLLLPLSAVLLILSFPKIDQPLLAWIALIPLLYVLKDKSVYRTFFLGWLCGFLFHIGLIYWIVVVTITYGKLIYPLGILVMLLLAGYLGLYVGFSFALARFIEKKTTFKSPLILPFTWVTMEYLKSFLFIGFPWESLGYSQYRLLPLIQCADITGVYGISFLIVYINATIFLFLQSIPLRKIPYKEIILAILMVSSVSLYGKWRLDEIRETTESSARMKVGLIQGNVDQGIKWNRASRKNIIDNHHQLSVKALQQHSRLIIWPEASTPFYFQSEQNYQDRIFDIIAGSDTYLLLGSPSFELRNGKWRNSNSAFLLSPTKKVLGKYDKIQLVPYGEYVPLKRFFPFIHKMVAGIGNFYPGQEISLLTLPEASFAVLICYEIIFPDLTRRFVKNGAQFLTNITNDAWFGKTSAPYQHLSMATFRAVENRRFIARAANTGISALIDATGKIKSSSTLFTEALITGTIALLTIPTFYTNYGDVFAMLCTLISAALLSFSIIRKFRGHRG